MSVATYVQASLGGHVYNGRLNQSINVTHALAAQSDGRQRLESSHLQGSNEPHRVLQAEHEKGSRIVPSNKKQTVMCNSVIYPN